MWLTIVLERHLLQGSNVKIRLNTPSPGFAFQQWEFLWKNFHSARAENNVLAANAIKILLPGRILAGIPEKSFSLGGIPASTDFSAGFLPRYVAGIFSRKDPAGKTGHLGGIPARSRYLFYKGEVLKISSPAESWLFNTNKMDMWQESLHNRQRKNKSM